ncbi:hypothetical protein ACOME3_007885 [Neoechinorhynchus agilis]
MKKISLTISMTGLSSLMERYICTIAFERGKQTGVAKITRRGHKLLYSKINAVRSVSAVPCNPSHQITQTMGTQSSKLYYGWLKAHKADCVDQLGLVPELHEKYVTSSMSVRFQLDLIPKAIHGDFAKGRSGLMEGA